VATAKVARETTVTGRIDGGGRGLRREVMPAVVSAAVAGFFWGAVLYEVIGGSWGRVG
jgi:hypothetical protein